MKTVAIVQARMSSTRLPGKILKTVLDKPLLSYQIERLSRVPEIDQIVLATTTNKADDVLVKWCQDHNVAFYRGSEDDVLSRYYEAAKKFGADHVVRITSDCPLIDPQVISWVLQAYQSDLGCYDYVSNCYQRSFPRGMDTEVLSFGILEKMSRSVTESEEREHVTLSVFHHPESYRVLNVDNPHGDWSHWRWTVDTAEDFSLIKMILEALYPVKPEFTLADVAQLMIANPDWQNINSHIKQKIATGVVNEIL